MSHTFIFNTFWENSVPQNLRFIKYHDFSMRQLMLCLGLRAIVAMGSNLISSWFPQVCVRQGCFSQLSFFCWLPVSWRCLLLKKWLTLCCPVLHRKCLAKCIDLHILFLPVISCSFFFSELFPMWDLLSDMSYFPLAEQWSFLILFHLHMSHTKNDQHSISLGISR